MLVPGASKFYKVSIFSDLNNLTDLTMNRPAATLLGYTQAELEANFPEHIAALGDRDRGQGPRARSTARLRDRRLDIPIPLFIALLIPLHFRSRIMEPDLEPD